MERLSVSDSHSSQAEAQLRKFSPRNFRRVMIGAPFKILERVEANDTAGSGASGTAGSLRGGGFAHAADFERREPSPGRIACDARQSAVDHGGDAFDGNGTLRDIGG